MATEFGLAKHKDGIVLETNIGNIPVMWHKEGEELAVVEMTQVTPQTQEIAIDFKILSQMIGVKSDSIDLKYPIKLANTGNWHLLVPIKDQEAIDAAMHKSSKKQLFFS